MSFRPLRDSLNGPIDCVASQQHILPGTVENMYYHGFDKKFPSGSKYWTMYDDQLIGMLFSKIVNKTMSVENAENDSEELVDEMVQNLFDLCFYINKDFHDC